MVGEQKWKLIVQSECNTHKVRAMQRHTTCGRGLCISVLSLRNKPTSYDLTRRGLNEIVDLEFGTCSFNDAVHCINIP